MLTVLLGGVRSGKSAFALRLASRLDGDVTFVATCPRIDGDVLGAIEQVGERTVLIVVSGLAAHGRIG